MNIVKTLMQQSDMTQTELAKEIGVSNATVSDWCRQRKDPRGENLQRLSALFGVDKLIILGVNTRIEDETVMDLREALRRSPEMRMLFSAARKATPDHLRAAAAMLKALEPEDDQ